MTEDKKSKLERKPSSKVNKAKIILNSKLEVKKKKFRVGKNMEVIKNRALKVVLEVFNRNKDYLPLKKNFDIVISLALYGKVSEAKFLMDKLLKFQTKSGDFEYRLNGIVKKIEPVYFLFALTKFVSVARLDDFKILKKYIKSVKKSLDYLERNLDETFLLLGSKNLGVCKFKTKNNVVVINFKSELSDFLNEVGFNKQADDLFMLKGKLELGIKRYLWNQENKILLKSFKNDFSFKVASIGEVFDILTYDVFDTEFLKEFLNEKKEEILNEKRVGIILDYLILLKQVNLKDFNKKFEDFYDVLKCLPEFLENKSEYDIYTSINKSLNPDFESVKCRKIDDENEKILVNLDSIEISNKFLRLYGI